MYIFFPLFISLTESGKEEGEEEETEETEAKTQQTDEVPMGPVYTRHRDVRQAHTFLNFSLPLFLFLL